MPALADDWLRPTAERGLVKKCTYCGALSPNPTRMNEPCWNCHRPLKDECPHCGLPMMFYDVEEGAWRCANNQCTGKHFAFDKNAGAWNTTVHRAPTPPPRTRKRRPSQPSCPRCGAGLIYSNQQSLWCCVVCRDFFTPEQAGYPAPQDAPIPVRPPTKRERNALRAQRPRRERGPGRAAPAYEPMPRPRKKKTTGDYVLLAIAVCIIIAMGIMVILGMSGQFG
jgi:ribosomal protein L37AE/L43A